MAEFYDLIRVYGSQESQEESFQGLGAAALYNSGAAQPQSGEGDITVTTTGGGVTTGGGASPAEDAPELPETLWNMQTEVIKRQSDFLMTISGTYAEKMAALPQQPSWWGVVGESAVEYAVGWLANFALARWVGEAAEATTRVTVIREIVSFLSEFAFNAWDYVKKYYNDTGKICLQMKAENDALCALERSFANYGLRTNTLNQHEATMKNLIDLIDTIERDMQRALPQQESMAALIQAIQDLRFNGASLQFPDGHVFTMVGATVSQEATFV